MRQKKPGKYKSILLIGAGAQGRAWAHNLATSGWKVQSFVRNPGKLKGLLPNPARPLHVLPDLLKNAPPSPEPVVAFLTPDETHLEVIQRYLPEETPVYGVFAHGYTPTYEVLPAWVRPVLCAPKLVGSKLVERYVKGKPVPIAVGGSTPRARALAARLGLALGAAPSTLIRAHWQQETEADLFSEQSALCGGVALMVAFAFEQLVKQGIPPKAAWAEILFELDMLLNLYVRKGFGKTFEGISAKAAYGAATYIRHFHSAVKMQQSQVWKHIRNKSFHKASSRWTARQIRDQVKALMKSPKLPFRQLEAFYRRHGKWIKGITE
jgi:ketol-acid reductoisomerase